MHMVASAQAVIPISYAAQIPTTRNPDLANVRLSLSNVEHQVPECSIYVLFCVYVSVCLRVYV